MIQDEERCVGRRTAALGRFELLDIRWPARFETTAYDDAPQLAMTMLKPNAVGKLGHGRASYDTGSGPTDYRALGALVLRPADVSMHAVTTLSESLSGRMLMATFDRPAFESITGLRRWDAALLEHCFNVPSARLVGLMRSMARELAAPDLAVDAAVSGLAHLMLVELARTFARRPSCPNSGLTPWQLRTIQQHLNMAQGRWPTCAELAQLCGISTGHLSRSFRATTSVTLSDFAAEIRMERAKALLAAGEMSLQQTAAALGFNSPSSFSFAFRRHVGATPKDFRRKTRSGQTITSQLRPKSVRDPRRAGAECPGARYQ